MMKKLFGLFALIVLMGSLAGCWDSKPDFQPDPDFKPSAEMEEMANMAQ